VNSKETMHRRPAKVIYLNGTMLMQIELLDFGACREYSSDFLNKYGRILLSASRGDREGVWQHSKGLGFVTGYESQVTILFFLLINIVPYLILSISDHARGSY
jgi:hypothetical protein